MWIYYNTSYRQGYRKCDVPKEPNRCRAHLSAAHSQTESRLVVESTNWRSTWTDWTAPVNTKHTRRNIKLSNYCVAGFNWVKYLSEIDQMLLPMLYLTVHCQYQCVTLLPMEICKSIKKTVCSSCTSWHQLVNKNFMICIAKLLCSWPLLSKQIWATFNVWLHIKRKKS